MRNASASTRGCHARAAAFRPHAEERAFGPRTQIFNTRWRGVSKHESAASSPFEARAYMSEFVQLPQHARSSG
jgi:hypothetical protein